MEMMMQEVEFWYVLPAIRRALAHELKKMGLKNVEIADKMNLTKAAVTHYLDNDRATEFKLSKNIQYQISRSANKIIIGEPAVKELQKIIHILRNDGSTCEFHHRKEDVEKTCNICFRK